jgi:hypothetical protein
LRHHANTGKRFGELRVVTGATKQAEFVRLAEYLEAMIERFDDEDDDEIKTV